VENYLENKISIQIPENLDTVSLKLEESNEETVFVKIKIEGELVSSIKTSSFNICVKLEGSDHIEVNNSISVYRLTAAGDYLIGEIEFIKQSEKFLKNRYNFTKKNGYLILRRCTFELMRSKEYSENLNEKMLVVGTKEKNEIVEFIKEVLPDNWIELTQENKIIKKAALITQFLWEIFNDSGPSDLIDGNKIGLFDKLSLIYKESGTVQCSGTRDLFLGIFSLFETGVEVRKCDVFRYYPPIDNLVVNSHSLLEIKISGKWIAFDPYVRVYFTDDSGNLISVQQIFEAKQNNFLNKINVVYIDSKQERRKDFNSENNPYDPYGYNYFSTFGYVKYTALNFVHYDELLAETEYLIQKEELEKAMAGIKFVLGNNCKDLNMLNNLSVIEILLNRLDEATVTLKNILNIDPDNVTAKENLKYLEQNKNLG